MHPEHRNELLLDYLDRFVIAHRRGPTLVVLSREFHVSETVIRRDLRLLREHSCVTWLPHTPYTLRVVQKQPETATD
ncbi:MAG: hypothetical protein K8J31_04370 [Anaerolineae bacterium]|nr:hypothetical protein [Anaerolineae bacterium]